MGGALRNAWVGLELRGGPSGHLLLAIWPSQDVGLMSSQMSEWVEKGPKTRGILRIPPPHQR